jgi:hypothetical protein
LEKLNSDLVNDQFKNLRNNINLEHLENVIDEEDFDDEEIEDEELIMKPQINMNVKYTPIRDFRNSHGEISGVGNFAKRSLVRRKTEEIILDVSNDIREKGMIFENEIDVKFKEENAKEYNPALTVNRNITKLSTILGDNDMPSDNNNNVITPPANTAPAYKSMKSIDGLKKSHPHVHHEAKCNCKGKFDEYNKHISFFISKVIKLCQTSTQMIKWIDQSYNWIEDRYLSNSIKDTKKSLIKRTKAQE